MTIGLASFVLYIYQTIQVDVDELDEDKFRDDQEDSQSEDDSISKRLVLKEVS